MATRRYRFVHVDVFTRRAFGGNQLAVFTDARGLSDAQMQDLAREMNFSESTFVLPAADPGADAKVRIFTPTRELPFAGHPTVGSGYVLGLERGRRRVALELAVGTLSVESNPGDGPVGSAQMEQPLPRFRPVGADSAVLAATVGLSPDDLAAASPPEFGSAGVEFLYLPLRSLDAIRRARADLDAMQRVFGDSDHPAIYPFSLETESPDAAAHARMFSLLLGPGVNEDPASGSAAGPLGAYLVRHGLSQPGALLVEQGYEMQRPSQLEVQVELAGGEVSRVRVGGGVVRVAEGELFI
jgi:trans-2,3-dihydro-3-hydroxyanthranilate isomerase